jgi:hypothetical protein
MPTAATVRQFRRLLNCTGLIRAVDRAERELHQRGAGSLIELVQEPGMWSG